MYGAMIGDIVGSKYEFDNIKTKDFPLFSPDCDDTDDSIMTVAVAKAILLRREAQVRGEARPLRETLIETMQDFGRRYPSPKGSYGSHFALWLQAAQPPRPIRAAATARPCASRPVGWRRSRWKKP